MTLDDFLTLTLPKRIAWLHSHDGPKGKLSHDIFGQQLGTSRQQVINWENGAEPTSFADALATWSGFPREAFLRREAEPLVEEMYRRRLQELEDQVAQLATRADLEAALEPLREAIQKTATQRTRQTNGKRKPG